MSEKTTTDKFSKEIDHLIKRLILIRNHPLDEVVPQTKKAMKKVLSEFFQPRKKAYIPQVTDK